MAESIPMNFDSRHFLKRLYEKSFAEDIFSGASQMAFYFVLAIFPLLIFLLNIFGFLLGAAERLQMQLFMYLKQLMPGQVFDLVQITILEVAHNSTGGKLTFGLLLALWSASAGIDSIRVSLNAVHGLKETRSWFKTKTISLMLTFFSSIMILIALSIVFYGTQIVTLILTAVNLETSSMYIIYPLVWLAGIIALLFAFSLFYTFLPNYPSFHWVWVSPGAIVGIVLWRILTYGFSVYLNYFNTYDRTYGSLGTVIILLLWLYLTALVILIGGEINAICRELTNPGSKNKTKLSN
jgi:membrane protein